MYLPVRVAVNRPALDSVVPAVPRARSGLVGSLTALLLILAVSGCVAPVKRITSEPYLLAVRYDVEPVFTAHGSREAMDNIRGDFETIAELGFPTVLLQHVDGPDRPALLELAGKAGLTAVIPAGDRHFVRYTSLRGASGPIPKTQANRGPPPESRTHPALAGLVTHGSFGPTSSARGEALTLGPGKDGIPRIRRIAGTGPGAPRSASLATVDTRASPRGSEGSLLEDYLARFHTGLAGGRTAGLIVDRYRRPTGDPPGLIIPGEQPSPARAAAIKKLIMRARQWGPRLCRLTAWPVADVADDSASFQVTVLAGERRRYLLVFNPSLDSYGRGEVHLPELLGGAPTARAVEVPPEAGMTTGRVIDARHGRLAIPVTLRPGDAALFEVF